METVRRIFYIRHHKKVALSSLLTHNMNTRLKIATLLATPLALLAIATPVFAQTLYRQLDIGSSGSDVSALQTFLAQDSSIYPQGLVTGYYGQLTAAAVARWQTKNGIAAVGHVGPITLAALQAKMGDTGGGVSTGTAAPILSPEIVSTTSTSATFTWASNVSAYPRVMYGTTWPFLYATAPSVTGTYGTAQSVTITGLQPSTTYYYVLESKDASGNYSWTIGKPFTTQHA